MATEIDADDANEQLSRFAATLGLTNAAAAQVMIGLRQMQAASEANATASAAEARANKASATAEDYKRAALQQARQVIGQFTQSIITVPNSIADSNQAFASVTGTISTFTGVVSNGIDSLGSFVAGLTAGPAAKAIDRFSKILGGGVELVGSAINMQINRTQQVVGMFDQLAGVGAIFGTSLEQARDAARAGGLSLETFSKLVSSNAANLSMLGGNVQQAGADVVKLTKTLSPGLITIYGGLENANQAVIDYLTVQAQQGVNVVRNQQQVTQGSQAYLLNLKELQILTGKSTQQLQAEMKARAERAAVQTALAEMSVEQRRNFDTAFAKLPASLQAVYTDIAAANAQGTQAFSQRFLELQAMSPEITAIMEDLAEAGKTMDPEQFNKYQASRENEILAITERLRKERGMEFLIAQQRPEAVPNAIRTLENVVSEMGPLTSRYTNAVQAQAAAAEQLSKTNTEFANTYTGLQQQLQAFKGLMEDLAINSVKETSKIINLAYKAAEIQYALLGTVVSGVNKLVDILGIEPVQVQSPQQRPVPGGPSVQGQTENGNATSTGMVQPAPGVPIPAQGTPVSRIDPSQYQTQMAMMDEMNRLLRQISQNTA